VKGWAREGHTPNEAFDLHTYNRAVCILLRAEAIDWQKPPEWASQLSDRLAQQKALDDQRAAKAKIDRRPRRNWIKQW
jgi:phage terminase large subunit GpA-like protein